jgi:hypothetical protein
MYKFLLFILILLIPITLFGQFKAQNNPDISSQIAEPATSFLFGFLNPDRLTMNHYFSASYMTMGNHSLMLNSYINAIQYRISDPLTLQLNLGIANIPYNTFQGNSGLNDTQFFGGAELKYRPSGNTSLSIGVNVTPGYYYGYPYRYGY